MNVHAVAMGIQEHFSGAFDLTLHEAGKRPKRRDGESGEQEPEAPDVEAQTHVKVPRDKVSSTRRAQP